MALLTRAWQGLKLVFLRNRLESDLEREFGFHLQMEIDRHVARGVPPAEARRLALRDFGGLDRASEEVRDARGITFWEGLRQDIRFGVRSLKRSPGYLLAAIVTLGLGIGANTAIFGVVNGVLLHPLPYRKSSELIRIRQDAPLLGQKDIGLAIAEVWDYRKALTTVDDVVEYHQMSFILLDHGQAHRVSTGVVSSSYFETFGVKLLFGRTFQAADDDLSAEPVLILSNAYWLKQFGGDESVVGRHVEMNDKVHTIVGILPPIPGYPDQNDVYMPTSACPFRARAQTTIANNRRAFAQLAVFARLKPGVSPERAGAQIAAAAQTFARARPDVYKLGVTGFEASLMPLEKDITQDVRPVIWMLLGTTGLILLIACANVANLSLSRTLRRERELALRTALGARRTRLVRQLMTESTMVAIAGGLFGLVLAWSASGLLAAFAGLFTPRAVDASIDGSVLLFALAVSVATGIGFGAIPAITARPALVPALKEGAAPAGDARRGLRVRSFLVVAQVAVGFALVTGAGLLLHSLRNLYATNLGYQHAEEVLSADVCCNFTRQGLDASTTAQSIYAGILQRTKALRGARLVAVTDAVPLSQIAPTDTSIHVDGQPAVDPLQAPHVDGRAASEDYFSLLGIPVLAGRTFVATDTVDSRRVAVINQTMSRLWASRDPVGTTFTVGGRGPKGGPPPTLLVVGVVGDVRQFAISDPAQAVFYMPVQQSGVFAGQLLIRTDGDPLRLSTAMRAAVRAVDPQVPVENVRTLEALREDKLTTPRLGAVLLAVFAGLALVITLAGLGAVIATSVSQRTREFGVRIALGASRGSVLGMVVRQGVGLLGVGLVLGVGGALTFGHVLSSYLYQTPVADPVVYAMVAALFLLTGLVACLGPARRAISTDPLLALRSE
jgi:putative ABC transport system permease protein